MNLIKDYARLIVFTAGILIGVQVPNFIDQYIARVSAHYAEARENFSGFQETADRHFDGSVEALIDHYEQSGDTVFQDDARNLKAMYVRMVRFADELRAMETSLAGRIIHVLFDADVEIRDETLAAYTYTVPLNRDAIICGLGLGLAASLLVELLLSGLMRLALMGVRPGRDPI